VTPVARVVPPLLPVWLPLIVAAILLGVVFAWVFPPPVPGGSPPLARFTDVTSSAGVSFVHRIGIDPAESPTTLGGGVVVFDCDGDGDDDLFFVNGAPWPWEETLSKHASRGGCALFRNDGAGRFADISAMAEVNIEFQGMAGAAGDFDNDGHPDLFVTGVGSNHLFRNRGGGRFEDVTDEAGVRGEENMWSTGATWFDYDGDGRLDLIVGHYARWPGEAGLAAAFSVALMGHSYGAPTGFFGVPPTVFRNLGDGRFTPVPGSAGLRPIDPRTGLPAAKLLAIAPLDANADGRLDLLFAFHTIDDVLFLNTGGGVFHPWSPPEERREGASADIVATGPLALLPGGGVDERFTTWRAAGALVPPDPEAALVNFNRKLGAALIDYDDDGRLDVVFGGGRGEFDVNRFDGGRVFSAPVELYWNRGEGWGAVTADAFPSASVRAVATADLDNDGDLDLVLTQFGGAPVLLRNDQRRDVPWLAIDLVATRTAREAGGARVEVHTPRQVHVQTAAPVMGLFAQSNATLRFGLGNDARVRRIVVHWPSGVRQEERNVAINRRITVTER
jgi:hypothetical protein